MATAGRGAGPLHYVYILRFKSGGSVIYEDGGRMGRGKAAAGSALTPPRSISIPHKHTIKIRVRRETCRVESKGCRDSLAAGKSVGKSPVRYKECAASHAGDRRTRLSGVRH